MWHLSYVADISLFVSDFRSVRAMGLYSCTLCTDVLSSAIVTDLCSFALENTASIRRVIRKSYMLIDILIECFSSLKIFILKHALSTYTTKIRNV